MVTNDDFNLTTHRQEMLNPMPNQFITANIATFNFEVPTGKRWNVKNVSAFRTTAEQVVIDIVDNNSNIMSMKDVTGAQVVLWEAQNEIWLPAGWKVVVRHKSGTSGYCDGFVMCVEEDII